MRVPQSSIFIGFFILNHPASGVTPWKAPKKMGSKPIAKPKTHFSGTLIPPHPAGPAGLEISSTKIPDVSDEKKHSSPRQMTVTRRQSHPTLIIFDLPLAVSTGILERAAFHSKTLWVSIITGRTWPSLRFLLVLYAHSCQFCNAVIQIWPWDIDSSSENI